jgi:excisionase family DNA binding protein
MNNSHSHDSNIARQRKLDALFADQPFLSTTMRASRLHERTDDSADFVLPPMPPLPDDADDVLRRMVEGRAGRRPYEPDDEEWWTEPIPAITREPVAPIGYVEPLAPAPAEKLNPVAPAGESRLHLDLLLDLTPEGPKVVRLQTSDSNPDVMTAKEAALYLRIGTGTLRNWTRTLAVPYIRIGKRMRYRKTALLAWLAEWERMD